MMKDAFGAPLLESLPGVCGHVARFVDSRLETSAPHISVPAALAFISAIKGGRVECPEGIAPNLYCCVVAGSGTGKSQAQRAIWDLIEHCEMGKLLMGKPASDSGVLKALQEQPRRLLIWDEFGIALSELSRSQASYRALILSTLMDLFSSAGKMYLGKEYANQDRVDVKNPHLSLFAASTPNRFFGALNQDFVEDGFLSRWLLFFSPEKLGTKKSNYMIPSDLLERLIEMNIGHTSTKAKGNLARILTAHKMMIKPASNQKLQKEGFKSNLAASKNEIQRIFWSRSYEQYLKLCMIFTDTDEVQHNESLIAAQIVDDITRAAIFACENSLYANERERTKEKFRALLKIGEEATLSAITRKSYRLNLSRSERSALIDDLCESGYWERGLEAGSGDKKRTIFRCIQ